MKTLIELGDQLYAVKYDSPASIAIEMHFSDNQPNHFGAPDAQLAPLEVGGFVGEVSQGGSCNVGTFTITPHCNGTHTESVAHVLKHPLPVHACVQRPLYSTAVISVTPVAADRCEDHYTPPLESSDRVIDQNAISQAIEKVPEGIEALVIRTIPNNTNKRSRRYSAQNQPAFFSHEAMKLIDASGIQHILVDLPSLDKMYDKGLLSNHRIFWHLKPGSVEPDAQTQIHRTVTEMVFVPEQVSDGLYALSLQVLAIDGDASPSRPLLYPLEQL